MYKRRRVFNNTYFGNDGTRTLSLNNASVPASKIAAGSVKTANLNAPTPVGTILATMAGSLPIGFALCFGQAINISAYSATAAAFARSAVNASATDSVWYPATSSTSYYTPDLRGRVLVGTRVSASRVTVDSVTGSFLNPKGASSTLSTVATAFGLSTHTLTLEEYPAHTHGVTATGASHNHTFQDSYPVWVTAATGTGLTIIFGSGTSAVTHFQSNQAPTITLVSTGSATAHENMTAGMIVDFILRSEWID